MKITRLGYSGEAVVILGAGATRGASFVPRSMQVLPPLDSDFFTQAQRLPIGEPSRLMRSLISDAVKVFGKNFRLTMEGFLTQIEHLANVLEDYRDQGRPPQNHYYKIRENFLQVLACVLHEALGTEPECEYHINLLSILEQGDTILSFNYDCVIDYILKTNGTDKWNAVTGYGHRCASRPARSWNPADPAPANQTILLLKMHGSLNWVPFPQDNPHRVLHLKERWWRQHGNVHFEIVPPEWNKPTIRRGVYKTVWTKARRRFRDCTAALFIGYSLPVTDLPAQGLFRVDAADGKKLKLLVIANPEPEVRQRIRDVLRRRITAGTRMLMFDSLKDFDAFLTATLPE